MQVPLAEALVEKLVACPETGMGYQLVDLVLRDGSIISRVPVFNSEIADVPPRYGKLLSGSIVDVRLAGRHA